MKRTLIIILSILGLAFDAIAQEATISPSGTYLFDKKADGELYLDVYDPAKGSVTSINGVQKPTILFMFGGGFIRGTRDDESYNKWFKMLSDNGFRVISIDYRLGLKGSNKVGDRKSVV